MKRHIYLIINLFIISLFANAQSFNRVSRDGTSTSNDFQGNRSLGVSDSIQSQHKEIPRGLKVWTIDERFGDRTAAQPDTVSELFMNTFFNTGLRGEYNSLGNLGSPRQNRIFIDRAEPSEFIFLAPYDKFIVQPSKFHFTSTLSPITNLSYSTASDRTDGEDQFKALFAINAGKKWGFGFKFDYLYGRGYYSNQNTSHINYSFWGTYTGEKYQANFLSSLNHQKVSENGGIANDAYITHPEIFNESFNTNEIPTILSKNWNRNDNQHIFFNHRYSLGFYRKVPMTKEEIEAKKFAIKSMQSQEEDKARRKAMEEAKQNGEEFDEEEFNKRQKAKGRPDNAKVIDKNPTSNALTTNGEQRDSINIDRLEEKQIAANDATNEWIKDEYVPVTSFIHTARFDNFRRIYQAYDTPNSFYANNYYYNNATASDSIYDQTKHWALKNTFAIALLEGFNKWAKAGLKAFVSHELRHYELPMLLTTTTTPAANPLFGGYEKINKNDISVGGQLLKANGKTLHYNINAEAWIAGDRAGQLHIDGNADLNFPLLGDTVQFAATAFLHRTAPTFYMNTFRSRHFWWDNNLDQQIHSRLLGTFSLKKTRTKLRVGYDVLKNYTYFGLQNERVANGNDYLVKNNQVNVRQHSGAISLLTLQLQQDFKLGIMNWQNLITFQKSSNETVLPTPTLNIYSNLFIRFKIAKVLDCDFGVDGRYFTKYYAPEYIPGMGSFGIQETEASRTEVGNYPIINAYANFKLQRTRFFIMMSHINSGDGGNYFFTPHYPLNQRVLRLGISWDFFN